MQSRWRSMRRQPDILFKKNDRCNRADAAFFLLMIVIGFFALSLLSAPGLSAAEAKKTVIVHVEDNVDVASEKISELFAGLEPTHVFKAAFTGLVYDLTEDEISQIRDLSEVARIDEEVTYEHALKESVPFIGAEDVRSHLDDQGVRLSGKGIKVGVIDTGIDYTHPDLQRNYVKGYDFIDDDDDPMETKLDGEAATFHGTHVAGIIAANGRVRGVAPDAELYVYRALGPEGQGSTANIIDAIDQAVEDGVDVLNLSLGSPVNGPDWPTSKALDEATEAGVITVTSNGNSGPAMWSVGSPGTSLKAISVGASTPPLRTPHLFIPDLKDEDARVQPIENVQGAEPWNFKHSMTLVDGGLGLADDLENANGKVVLIERGGIPLHDKLANAKEADAKAVLLMNHLPGQFHPIAEEPVDIISAAVDHEVGMMLKKELENHGNEITLKTTYVEDTDHMAWFSSRGPVTQTWDIKPDVVAPGVEIDSTIPEGHLSLNGTSMAAPHIAGAAALMKQARPDWTPAQVKAALMNTAVPLFTEEGERYPPFVQGAGRVDIGAAVESTSLVYPGALSFGVWEAEENQQILERELMIENHSEKTRTYSFEVPSSLGTGLRWRMPMPVSIEPGEKKKVKISLEIEADIIDFKRIDGEIKVTGGEAPITLPFLLFSDEPDYPRVNAFQFGKESAKGDWMYEVFLPGGAEELEITLYDPDTFTHVQTIDHQTDVPEGRFERRFKNDEFAIEPGVYQVLIYAKHKDKEDTLESMILILEDVQ